MEWRKQEQQREQEEEELLLVLLPPLRVLLKRLRQRPQLNLWQHPQRQQQPQQLQQQQEEEKEAADPFPSKGRKLVKRKSGRPSKGVWLGNLVRFRLLSNNAKPREGGHRLGSEIQVGSVQ